MMKKVLFLLLGCCLLAAQNAYAENTVWYTTPSHFLVVMPSVLVEAQESDSYEGVKFPLVCGIASVYPKENKFIFTKTTNLPIRWIEAFMRQIEHDGHFTIRECGRKPSLQVSLRDEDFFFLFKAWADSEMFKVYYLASGQSVPLNVTPRFKRMCPYNSTKRETTDCAYYSGDIEDLYIPFTEEEMEQIAKDHAK